MHRKTSTSLTAVALQCYVGQCSSVVLKSEEVICVRTAPVCTMSVASCRSFQDMTGAQNPVETLFSLERMLCLLAKVSHTYNRSQCTPILGLFFIDNR